MLTALERFFNTRPVAGSKLCVPRMFKSSRLAELVPGVFLPEYPQIVRPRQRLISTLAGILASFKRQHSAHRDTFDEASSQHRCTQDRTWYEERLWSSMVGARRMPAPARSIARHPMSPKASRLGTLGTHDNTSEVYQPEEQCWGANVDCEAYQLGSRHDIDRLTPCESEGFTDDEMLDMSSATSSDDGTFLLDASASDEETSPKTSAGIHADHRSKSTNKSAANIVSKQTSDCKLTMTAEFPKGDLSHVDQRGKDDMHENEQRENRVMIGQKLLIHDVHSTDMHEGRRVEELEEDLLILEDLQYAGFCSYSNLTIRNCAGENDLIPLEDDSCFTPLREITKQLDDQTSYLNVNMPSRSPRQSLSDALGGDHLLWNMWKRRGSAAPAPEADMLEMHNMFEHDPDMRLITSNRMDRSLHNDPMLFESFDISRNSTPTCESGKSSWFGTPVDEPVQDPMHNLRCSQPLMASQSSISTPKKMKRRPSLLQKPTLPHIMSEDDILFQQSSPTREVEIKKRKVILECKKS